MKQKIWEYSFSAIILIVILVFYWYSRNIVSGYYELLWFHNVVYSDITVKFFLVVPAVVYLLAIIIGVARWRRKKKLCSSK